MLYFESPSLRELILHQILVALFYARGKGFLRLKLSLYFCMSFDELTCSSLCLVCLSVCAAIAC
jgi:hypothetical protein